MPERLIKEFNIISERQSENGGIYWSRTDGNIHTPNGSSTIDTLFVLGEIGFTADKNKTLKDAIEFVFTYQSPDGSFKYFPGSSKLHCITARILTALRRLEYNDDRVEKAYKWLLDTQWNDGSWRCPVVKLGRSPITDAGNPGTTLYVLDAFRYRKNDQGASSQLSKGVDFLLQHWEVRQPVGPCKFGIGSRFLQIEYPFLRYNIFYYVYVLSFYEFARNDSRFGEAYKFLSEKAKEDRIIPENPHRAWQQFNFAKKGQTSDIASKRWLEIKSNLKMI